MKIINPLYDLAFKYLMQNERYAKKVLSVILEMEVEDVHLEQQETIYDDERRNLRLFRLDFKATIRDLGGNRSTVLIELQKSKFDTDIERFRNYLGMSYMNRYPDLHDQRESISQVSEDHPKTYPGVHPIISVYILGYNLDDLPYLAVTVNRDVIDSVTKEKIQSESFFVTHLTHRSHIIQVKRLPRERRSRLENFLMFFNQAWCREKGYTRSQASAGIQWGSLPSHLILQPMGLVRGTPTCFPLVSSSSALSRSFTVILDESLGLSTARPV
jgi:hypothetical protein